MTATTGTRARAARPKALALLGLVAGCIFLSATIHVFFEGVSQSGHVHREAEIPEHAIAKCNKSFRTPGGSAIVTHKTLTTTTGDFISPSVLADRSLRDSHRCVVIQGEVRG